MQDHIVFLNCPAENGLDYFEQAVSQMRQSTLQRAQKPVIIVSDRLEDGLSQDLRELDVVHVSRSAHDPRIFEDASIERADTVVVLSQDMHDKVSDSLNFDLVHKFRERGVQATIIAEVLGHENRDRIRSAGADHVIRPIRSYPELLVRTILAPGTEQFIEDLFDVAGEECVRYNVELKASWGDVAAKMIKQDIGTPLACLSRDDVVTSSIKPQETIDAKAFFVLVREGNIKSDKQVRELLS